MAITLGDWVIEQALQQLEQWRSEELDIQVSVNISPQHLQSPGFFAALEAALARHPETDARALELEVLESSALDNLAETARVIDECHNVAARAGESGLSRRARLDELLATRSDTLMLLSATPHDGSAIPHDGSATPHDGWQTPHDGPAIPQPRRQDA